MKKFLLLIFTLCFIAALFIICGTAGGESGANSLYNKTKNENVIYIGVNEPLTGADAQGGLQEALGIRYANSVCPTVEIDGVTYDIILLEQDNISDINSAANSAKTLVNSNVTAVLGSYGSALTAASESFFAEAEIPVVAVSCTSPLLTTDSSNFFRICYSDTFQSGVIANYAFNMSCRNAAILTQTGDVYSKNIGKIISDEFSNLGGNTTSFNFQKGQENFRSLTDEIKESGADCVFMASAPKEAEHFIKQARKQGLDCPIIGLESWDSASFLNESMYYFSDVYFASEFDTNGTDTASSEFVAKFSSWLNRDNERIAQNSDSDYVSPASALAYDSYMIVVEAIKVANSSNSKAVMEAMKSISYDGVTGNITFDKNGESGKKLAYIKTVNFINKQFDVLQTNSVGK